MALVNCTECEKEVSDKAAFCPHCGCPDFIVKYDPYDDREREADEYEREIAKIQAEGEIRRAKIIAEHEAIATKRKADYAAWLEKNRVRCPFCRSKEVIPQKKGYSGKKGFIGTALFGGIGALAGTIGSEKMGYSCLSCGKWFAPNK